MPATITAKEQNLDEIFSNAYVFDIPVYQRPYAWTTEEVSDLLDDLTDAIERDDSEPYFLGSIVLIKSDGSAESEVVDGQQRLTTLTMLLCVLRDIFGDDDLEKFVLQAGNKWSGAAKRYRLSLRKLDREFFQDHVQNQGKLADFLKFDPKSFSDSRKRIFENVKYLHGELIKLDEEQLNKLTKYIINKCYLVVVAASDRKSAHRIFSVMNYRGLDLTPTDILKPEVLSEISSEESQLQYAEKWESIEADLGRSNFRELFSHIRMIYLKDKQREELAEEFRGNVLKRISGQEFADSVLEPYADVYKIVSRAAYESTEGAENVNQHLRHLSRLDNFDWIPPAMAYFHRVKGEQDKLIRFTRDLERLAYGLFIRRAYINERISRYSEVLIFIETGGDLFGENAPLQLRQEEKADILKILDGNIYELPRVPMPLLQRLDSLLADPQIQGYAPQAVSIEHVLPQNPPEKSEWLEWFPDPDERAQWTHRLANLVLLSRRKNSQASNYEFDKKKSEYFQKNGTTTFALTTQVVNESNWTRGVLEHRQKTLVELLKNEWRLA